MDKYSRMRIEVYRECIEILEDRTFVEGAIEDIEKLIKLYEVAPIQEEHQRLIDVFKDKL